CKPLHVDLAVLIDWSSLRLGDFHRVTDALLSLVSHLDIGPEKSRVSVVSFGHRIYMDESFNLTAYASNVDLTAAIRRLQWDTVREADTAMAIRFLQDYQLPVQLARPNIKRIGLVITDGNSKKFDQTQLAVRTALDSGIDLMSVAVGNSANYVEIFTIAGWERQRVFRLDNVPWFFYKL
ncbi:collagen alpha-1(XII) chain, partial [Elysia marginata]